MQTRHMITRARADVHARAGAQRQRERAERQRNKKSEAAGGGAVTPSSARPDGTKFKSKLEVGIIPVGWGGVGGVASEGPAASLQVRASSANFSPRSCDGKRSWKLNNRCSFRAESGIIWSSDRKQETGRQQQQQATRPPPPKKNKN